MKLLDNFFSENRSRLTLLALFLAFEALLYQSSFYSLDQGRAVFILKLAVWLLILVLLAGLLQWLIRTRLTRWADYALVAVLALAFGLMAAAAAHITWELSGCKGCGYSLVDALSSYWYGFIPLALVLLLRFPKGR